MIRQLWIVFLIWIAGSFAQNNTTPLPPSSPAEFPAPVCGDPEMDTPTQKFTMKCSIDRVRYIPKCELHHTGEGSTVPFTVIYEHAPLDNDTTSAYSSFVCTITIEARYLTYATSYIFSANAVYGAGDNETISQGRSTASVSYNPVKVSSFTADTRSTCVDIYRGKNVEFRCQANGEPHSALGVYEGSTVIYETSGSAPNLLEYTMRMVENDGNFTCRAPSGDTLVQRLQIYVTDVGETPRCPKEGGFRENGADSAAHVSTCVLVFYFLVHTLPYLFTLLT